MPVDYSCKYIQTVFIALNDNVRQVKFNRLNKMIQFDEIKSQALGPSFCIINTGSATEYRCKDLFSIDVVTLLDVNTYVAIFNESGAMNGNGNILT